MKRNDDVTPAKLAQLDPVYPVARRRLQIKIRRLVSNLQHA
jgi:hypothetical protein